MTRKAKVDDAHRNFIHGLPCIVCGKSGVECAHVRYADARAGKPITGTGTKPNDHWCLPLCPQHHREQHAEGEKNFWRRRNLDPIFLALALWQATGDHEAGEQIVRHAYFHS